MSKSYQVVTDRLIAQLEAGTIPWRKPWSTSGLGACKSLTTQKPYRGINAFLTALAGFESPWFLTYKQAEELGANVKKGETGLPVVFWGKVEREGPTPQESKDFMFMRHYTVFNVSQVENLRLSESLLYPKRKVSEFTPIEACERISSGMPSKPRLVHDKESAFYSPSLDYVNMPKPESFDKAEEYYSTLFHELGHSTGHESRLNRKGLKTINRFGDHAYSQEELVAEMTAAFLCSNAGIDAATETNAASYLASWLKVLKAEPKMLIQAAGQAQKAADFILGQAVQS